MSNNETQRFDPRIIRSRKPRTRLREHGAIYRALQWLEDFTSWFNDYAPATAAIATFLLLLILIAGTRP